MTFDETVKGQPFQQSVPSIPAYTGHPSPTFYGRFRFFGIPFPSAAPFLHILKPPFQVPSAKSALYAAFWSFFQRTASVRPYPPVLRHFPLLLFPNHAPIRHIQQNRTPFFNGVRHVFSRFEQSCSVKSNCGTPRRGHAEHGCRHPHRQCAAHTHQHPEADRSYRQPCR